MNNKKHKYCICFTYHLIGNRDLTGLQTLCILHANNYADAINELLVECYNLDYQLTNISSIERIY